MPGDLPGPLADVNGQGNRLWRAPAGQHPGLAGPTVTPAPTQTPVAGIIFTVDRNAIKAGECVNFAWKVENVQEVYFYRDGESLAGQWRGRRGTRRVPAGHDHLLPARRHARRSVEVREITIYVEPVADAPQITRFTVDPPGQITLGQCVTLRWQVEGELDQVTPGGQRRRCSGTERRPAALPGLPGREWERGLWVGGDGSGRHQPRPAEHQRGRCGDGDAGTNGCARAAGDYSFVVDPAQIQAGECVGISWSVGGGTTYSRILRNGVVIIDDAGYSGQQMDCLETLVNTPTGRSL